MPRPLTDRGKGAYWTVNDNVDPRSHRPRKKQARGSPLDGIYIAFLIVPRQCNVVVMFLQGRFPFPKANLAVYIRPSRKLSHNSLLQYLPHTLFPLH